jgi:hypothetical protein
MGSCVTVDEVVEDNAGPGAHDAEKTDKSTDELRGDNIWDKVVVD